MSVLLDIYSLLLEFIKPLISFIHAVVQDEILLLEDLFVYLFVVCLFLRYYKWDLHVRADWELQAYINELSASGTGHNGGIGRVRISTNHDNRTVFKMSLRIISLLVHPFVS